MLHDAEMSLRQPKRHVCQVHLLLLRLSGLVKMLMFQPRCWLHRLVLRQTSGWFANRWDCLAVLALIVSSTAGFADLVV